MDELTEVREALRSGEVSQNALALRSRALGEEVSQRSLSNLARQDSNPTVRVVRAAYAALLAIRVGRLTETAKPAPVAVSADDDDLRRAMEGGGHAVS